MSIEPMGPLIANLFLDGPMKGAWVPGYKDGQLWIEQGYSYAYEDTGVVGDVSVATWRLTPDERARFKVEERQP